MLSKIKVSELVKAMLDKESLTVEDFNCFVEKVNGDEDLLCEYLDYHQAVEEQMNNQAWYVRFTLMTHIQRLYLLLGLAVVGYIAPIFISTLVRSSHATATIITAIIGITAVALNVYFAGSMAKTLYHRHKLENKIESDKKAIALINLYISKKS